MTPAPTDPLDIRVFQIYFRQDQCAHLAPEFIPLDNSGQTDPLLEVGVFRRLYGSEPVTGAGLWGAVSWKFADKSGISASEWLAFIRNNPGYDVYFCNPHPEIEALFENPWLQGDSAHPHFLPISFSVLRGLGLDAEELLKPMLSHYVSTANYFVGTPRFWATYIAFIDRTLEVIGQLPEKTRRIFDGISADPKQIHNNATYLPFLMERLFSVFLSTYEHELSALKLVFEFPDTPAGRHMHHLRNLKDIAIQHRSDELMDAWMNYRELAFKIRTGSRSTGWFSDRRETR